MNLVLALTGASGSYVAKSIMKKSKWPITLIASKMGRMVYEQEVDDFSWLEENADQVWKDSDLSATVSSGSVPTVGMVVVPCSANTLGKVSHGIADSLVSRAVHCHLKERRKLFYAFVKHHGRVLLQRMHLFSAKSRNSYARISTLLYGQGTNFLIKLKYLKC